jgi:hypothetical protein
MLLPQQPEMVTVEALRAAVALRVQDPKRVLQAVDGFQLEWEMLIVLHQLFSPQSSTEKSVFTGPVLIMEDFLGVRQVGVPVAAALDTQVAAPKDRVHIQTEGVLVGVDLILAMGLV